MYALPKKNTKKRSEASTKGLGYELPEFRRFLLKVSRVLSSSLDYETTIKAMSDLIVPYMADCCMVDILKSDTSIELLTITGRTPEKKKLLKTLWKKVPPDMTLPQGVGQVIRTGSSELYPHYKEAMSERARANALSVIMKLKINSVMVVPLASFKKVFGAITFFSFSDRVFDQDDLFLAEQLCRHAGAAIDNSMLFSAAQKELKERRKAEEKLQGAYNKLTRLLEATNESFFSVDKEFRYTYLNKNSLMYAKKPIGELIGKKMMDVYPNIVDRMSFKKMREVMKTREPQEFEEKLEDGWFEVRIYPYDDGIAVSYYDISDRKQLEQRKDEFISMASHELKTPITSLKLYAELLDKKPAPREQAIYLSHVNAQIDKLSKLVRDLLDVSRMQIGKLQFNKRLSDLNSIARSAADDMNKISESHTIAFRGSRKALPIMADKDRIEQIILNLLTNAVKYSPNAKKICVKAGTVKGYACVSVEDFGVGINKEDQRKIFSRFFQVASSAGHTFPGLGIGLYISKIISDNHGGKIEIESESGKGSTFTFKIPLHTSRKSKADKK